MKTVMIGTALMAAMMMATPAMAKSYYDDDRSRVATKEMRHDRHGGELRDRARVTRVEPIYRVVSYTVPRRECSRSEVRYERSGHNSAGGMILGGLIGGAIAGEVVGGTNAKIAGAVVGSALGHDMASNRYDDGRDYRSERRCRTVDERHERREVDGYRVQYRYHGETFVTRMDREPGRYIDVRVDVRPERSRF